MAATHRQFYADRLVVLAAFDASASDAELFEGLAPRPEPVIVDEDPLSLLAIGDEGGDEAELRDRIENCAYGDEMDLDADDACIRVDEQHVIIRLDHWLRREEPALRWTGKPVMLVTAESQSPPPPPFHIFGTSQTGNRLFYHASIASVPSTSVRDIFIATAGTSDDGNRRGYLLRRLTDAEIVARNLAAAQSSTLPPPPPPLPPMNTTDADEIAIADPPPLDDATIAELIRTASMPITDRQRDVADYYLKLRASYQAAVVAPVAANPFDRVLPENGAETMRSLMDSYIMTVRSQQPS